MIVVYWLVGLIPLLTYGYYLEKKVWNKGICVRCNNSWNHFDNDSQGGRGYSCKEGHYAWISYPVDK